MERRGTNQRVSRYRHDFCTQSQLFSLYHVLLQKRPRTAVHRVSKLWYTSYEVLEVYDMWHCCSYVNRARHGSSSSNGPPKRLGARCRKYWRYFSADHSRRQPSEKSYRTKPSTKYMALHSSVVLILAYYLYIFTVPDVGPPDP